MISKLWKRLNPVFRGLIMGILFCGVLFQAVFMWMAGRKLYFTFGLWIGIGLALFMAWHMYYSLDNALDLRDEEAANKYMTKMYAIRAGVVLILFLLTYYFDLGNMLALFAGMISLKIAGYILALLQYLKKS